MSSRGEFIPEVGQIIANIADKIDSGEATDRDAVALRKLAKQFAGTDPSGYLFKLHKQGKGRPPHGGLGVDTRFQIAVKIQNHIKLHQCTVEKACDDLSGEGGVGPDRLSDFWQEMSPLLKMGEGERNVFLLFKRLNARNTAKK